MTVKQLKAYLEVIPEDTRVMIEGLDDEEYNEADVCMQAILTEDGRDEFIVLVF